MFISEIENDALNQAKPKLNEIKINGNHEIFEIPVIHTGLSPRFLCHSTTFVRLAGTVGCQSALHKENSGFATPTLGRHISTFRGYRIIFSIRNPYINRFTNYLSIHSQPSYPQKVVLHSSTARFSHRPYHFAMSVYFSTICHVTSRKLRLLQCIMGDDLHI